MLRPLSIVSRVVSELYPSVHGLRLLQFNYERSFTISKALWWLVSKLCHDKYKFENAFDPSCYDVGLPANFRSLIEGYWV